MTGREARQADDMPIRSAKRAGPIARRLVYALALLAIVPATAIAGVVCTREWVGLGSFDETHGFHLICPILWVVLSIVIWRGAIVWTLGRGWLTALIGMIPFAQVVYGQAIWDAGCINVDLLRVGQHEIGIGVWVWLTIWVWWGSERTRMLRKGSARHDGDVHPPMSPTATRIVASIGSVPFTFGVFLVFIVAMDDLTSLSEELGWAWAYGLSSIVAVVTWTVIWGRAVAWSGRVWARTLIGAIVLLIIPSVAQVMVVNRGDALALVLVGVLPVIGWGLWMAGTVNLWPMRVESGGFSDAPPQCISCGYLLIGLRGTRCPECGDEPTLDELWRATAGDPLA